MYVESFHARQRDKCLNISSLGSVLHAKALNAEWIHEFNHIRGHSRLNYPSPINQARSYTHRK